MTRFLINLFNFLCCSSSNRSSNSRSSRLPRSIEAEYVRELEKWMDLLDMVERLEQDNDDERLYTVTLPPSPEPTPEYSPMEPWLAAPPSSPAETASSTSYTSATSSYDLDYPFDFGDTFYAPPSPPPSPVSSLSGVVSRPCAVESAYPVPPWDLLDPLALPQPRAEQNGESFIARNATPPPSPPPSPIPQFYIPPHRRQVTPVRPPTPHPRTDRVLYTDKDGVFDRAHPDIQETDEWLAHFAIKCMRRICASGSQLALTFAKLDDEATRAINRLLVMLMPDSSGQLEPIEVDRILKHSIREHGLDYYVTFKDGCMGFVRDIDFIFVPCAESLLAAYWSNPRRSISVSQIRFLLSLPYYEFSEGDFLRELLNRMGSSQILYPY
ncbi:hypothetical protein EXIGLDRAFT_777624 [Exidia glandulosa HHB12029]|uniref:Uncharacterized protein n=1 Tax=Exidia glandulosa HHB12029 TaxID=1314781 RepID=A0A165CXH9_EXIGL|nr:hypothetical protein EXIGLDRAFT_777624 [Exidia glandulosa HHB12029]